VLVKRLMRKDAAKLLRRAMFDPAEAEKLRAEEAVLRAKLVELGTKFRNAPPEFTEAALDDINEQLAAIAAQQEDQDKRRVLDGIPLGTDKVADKVKKLTPGRYRAVLDALMTVTVLPVGKGGHVFQRDRIEVVWK
jgi:hypothetical protein